MVQVLTLVALTLAEVMAEKAEVTAADTPGAHMVAQKEDLILEVPTVAEMVVVVIVEALGAQEMEVAEQALGAQETQEEAQAEIAAELLRAEILAEVQAEIAAEALEQVLL